MNILVIGNGFDLAHNLPTKYSDFLNFMKAFQQYLYISDDAKTPEHAHKYQIFLGKLSPQFSSMSFPALFSELEQQNPKAFQELVNLSRDNILLKHFESILDDFTNLSDSDTTKVGWIDFESEISKIVIAMDEIRISLIEQSKDGNLRRNTGLWYYSNLNEIFYKEISSRPSGITQKDIQKKKKEYLYDLNRLIRCLEIYLSYFVQKLTVDKHEQIQSLNIDFILSFNYTNTAERLYTGRGGNPITFDFVHGKTDIDHNKDTCNMVLGIDEYLPEGKRDSDNEFIEFKKFYQRIYKATGSHYKDWIEKRREKNRQLPEGQEPEGMNVYIYGHSLDVTDRDILRDLILEEGAVTTIFYYSKEDLGQKIANLVKVIGEDELIRRTGGGQNKSIIFKVTTKEN